MLSIIVSAFTILTTVLLQIYVSRQRDTKYMGLILPSQYGLMLIIMLCGIGASGIDTSAYSMLDFLEPAVYLAGSLIIYAVCRLPLKKQAELDKMERQDLE